MHAAIPDDRLRLMFACAHPAIDPEAVRAPLMLQTVLGFDAGAIASAFLVAPATMGQRLVRAKRKIREAGIPFRVPERDELRERLDAVLDAIYAAFAEGWADPAGTVARRRDLAEEAIWLGRLVASLLPDEPEALGLLALMLHAEARRAARRDPAGDFVPLAEQDPARWDAALIDEAESAAVARERHGRGSAASSSKPRCSRRMPCGGAPGRTDWAAILRLYDALLRRPDRRWWRSTAPSRSAELHGPRAALVALDASLAMRRLAEYQPYWAARAGLLALRRRARGRRRRPMSAPSASRPIPAVRRFLQQRRAANGRS